MMRARLRIEVAGLQPYEVLLDREVNSVGRAVENTIGLRDMNVSRKHFLIRAVEEGFVVVDLGSRNGTMVNGELVNEWLLREGDRITVGSSALTYYPEGANGLTNAGMTTPSSGGIPLTNVGMGTPHAGVPLEPRPMSGRVSRQHPVMQSSGVITASRASGRFSGWGAASGVQPSMGEDFGGRVEMFAPPPNAAPTTPVTTRKEFRASSRLLDQGSLVKTIKSHRDRWRRLAEISAIIGTETDLGTLLEALVDALLQLVPSRGAFLVRHRKGEFKLEVARNLDREEIDPSSGLARLSTQICRQAVSERRPILTDKAMDDAELNQYRSVNQLEIESVLCLPFGNNEIIHGVIYLDNPATINFTSGEDELLEIVAAFGNLAGLAVQNASLLSNIKQRERIDQELRIAAKIQQSLLPRGAPVVPGLEVAGRSSPAKEIGGDLYTFIPRTDTYGDLLIGIGDVSGKGIGAGLVGSSIRSLLHAFASVKLRTDEILIEANRVLSSQLETGIFVSFLLIRFDPRSGQLFYTGAGHEHLITYRAATGTCEKSLAGGTVLGPTSDLRGKVLEKPLPLDEGDLVVLYTDGATEQTNAQGEEFGINRVGQVVLSRGRQPCEEIVHALFETVQNFRAGVAQADDLTVVSLRKRAREASGE